MKGVGELWASMYGVFDRGPPRRLQDCFGETPFLPQLPQCAPRVKFEPEAIQNYPVWDELDENTVHRGILTDRAECIGVGGRGIQRPEALFGATIDRNRRHP